VTNGPFRDAGDKSILAECAVLYLDILGVSAMARGDRAEEELRRFEEAIRSAFQFELGTVHPSDETIRAAVFSDSFVAAIPSGSDETGARAEAISNLLFEAVSIQAQLALADYSVRGAVTVGRCHFHEGLIFGPALVEAVRLEQEGALDPRVVLSPGAVETLRAGRGERAVGEPIRIDHDGLSFVDYLNSFSEDPGVELGDNLEAHRAIVARNLEAHATDLHRWRKHLWLAEYHNDFVRRQEAVLRRSGIEPAQMRIDVVDRHRRSRPVRPLPG
jgi:hypothetical protein